MKKTQIIESISDRIKSEYRKYHNATGIDWVYMAAIKIYGSSFVDKEANIWIERVLFFVIGIAVGIVTITFLK